MTRQSLTSQMIDGVFPPKKAGDLSKLVKDRNASAKVCPLCYMIVYNGVRVCHGCLYEFYVKKVRK